MKRCQISLISNEYCDIYVKNISFLKSSALTNNQTSAHFMENTALSNQSQQQPHQQTQNQVQVCILFDRIIF